MAIAFVKEVGNVDAADGNATIALVVGGNNVTAGELLCVAVISEDDTQTVTSVVDDVGSSYTVGQTQQITAGDTFRITEAYAIAAANMSGLQGITVNLSSAAFNQKKMKVLSFSGTSSTPDDGATSAKDDVFPRTTAFTNMDSGPITPTDVAGIAVGHHGDENLISDGLSQAGDFSPPGAVLTPRGTLLTGGVSRMFNISITWTGLGQTSFGPQADLNDHYFGTTIRAFKTAAGAPAPTPGPPLPSAARTFYVG